MIPVLQPLGLTKKTNHETGIRLSKQESCPWHLQKKEKANWKTSELKNSSPASKPFSRNHYAIQFVIWWKGNTGIWTRMWFSNHALITSSQEAESKEKVSHTCILPWWYEVVRFYHWRRRQHPTRKNTVNKIKGVSSCFLASLLLFRHSCCLLLF